MHAILYHQAGDFRVEQVPDPVLHTPLDVLVRVELSAICGSDLHVWHGREVGLDAGTIMGHEFVGEVLEVGREVTRFRPGDRVVAPFTTSCGACFYCRTGLTARCERGQLFGWVERGKGLQGAQAQLVRVPLAESTLMDGLDALSNRAALLLGDVLSTGYHCARQAGVGPGVVCAVLGCGPVGLMAILASRELGAARVFAIDLVEERLARARVLGADSIHGTEDAIPLIRDLTDGRGVDAVLEAIGSAEAGRIAFELVRPGGTISVVGVHHEPAFPFTPGQAYDKNLTWRIGRCPARAHMEQLLPLAEKHQAALEALFTHILPLTEGIEAYRMFAERRDGCLKVALRP